MAEVLASPKPPRSALLKGLLIADSIVSLIAIPLALFWGLMSGMSTTTTDDAAFANAYVLVNLTLPVALLVCLIGAWTAFAFRRERVAWTLMFLPLAWV
ncbi:MAG: hypothetical protein EON85_05075, partial [Brevundimonas sp.]